MLLFYSDNSVIRTGHAHVSQERCPLMQDALIRGRNVGMRTNDGSHASIQIPAHGHLFRGCLGVKVHEDHLRLNGTKYLVRFPEWIVVARHEDAALQIDHCVSLSRLRLPLENAYSRC